MRRDIARNKSVYLLCYGLFTVVLALTVVVFFIWRVALLELISVLNGRSYANRSLYMLGMIGIGIALFTVVMFAEPYLRFGVERRQLLHRFRRVALPLTIIAVVGVVIQFVLPG